MLKKAHYRIGIIAILITLCYPVAVLAYNTSVSNVEVTLSSNVVDRPVTFSLYCKTQSTLLGGQDTVSIQFPDAYKVSTDIRAMNVSVNGRDVSAIDYSNRTLLIMVPSALNIVAGELVKVEVASAVITNPVIAGDYQVTVTTSKDNLAVKSAYFHITDYLYPNGVSKPVVTVGTTESGQSVVYDIKFKTSVNGRLVSGEKIYLTFPIGTGMPSSIDGRYISINGFNLINVPVTIVGRRISLPLPSGLIILAQGNVEVVIGQEAALKNPVANDYQTIAVSTDRDADLVESFVYKVDEENLQVPSGEQKIVLVPSSDGAGQEVQYSITIKPNVLSRLGSQLDGFIITFPDKTVFPTSISPGSIKVNNIAAQGIILNSNNKKELIFTLPAAVRTNQQITITIDKSAGLKNPPPAQYRVDIGTLKDWNVFTSDYYVIKEQPTPSPSIPSNPQLNTGNKLIILQVDNYVATANSIAKTLEAPPAIMNNVTMVPLRFIADVLGASTEFNSVGNYVTIKYADKEMTLWVGSTLAKVNGAFASIQAPAVISNSRLMVPVRFISENFGAQVSWDGATRKITIIQGENTLPAAPTAPTTSPPSQYPIGYQAAIRAENSYVNVRSGPGTSFSIVSKVYKGERLNILGVEGDWYKVKLASGQEAWVANWVVDVAR